MSIRERSAVRYERRVVADMATQVSDLSDMTVKELCGKYQEVFGGPTRSRNKDYLRKKVAWRIQELAEGGLSDRARTQIGRLAAKASINWRKPGPEKHSVAREPQRDARLPAAGTVITRAHKGIEHHVAVLEDGFEYQGARYTGLSRIAREITGTNWNGFLFFKLQRRSHEQAKEKEA
jgi:hypothetical protein